MSRTCEAIDHASIAGYGPVRQSTLPPRIPHRVAANREPPPRRHNGLTIPGLADSGDCSCALDCLFPACALPLPPAAVRRSEEHTSELQSLMRISYAVFCLKKNINKNRS